MFVKKTFWKKCKVLKTTSGATVTSVTTIVDTVFGQTTTGQTTIGKTTRGETTTGQTTMGQTTIVTWYLWSKFGVIMTQPMVKHSTVSQPLKKLSHD